MLTESAYRHSKLGKQRVSLASADSAAGRWTVKYLKTFRSNGTTINNKISKCLVFVIVNNMTIIVMRDRFKHAILTALADNEMVKILECNIPPNVCK